MLSKEELAEIRARAEKASEGPWQTVTNRDRGPWVSADATEVTCADGRKLSHKNWKDACKNQVFAAKARTDIPALLAHIEELEREREEPAKYLKGLAIALECELDAVRRAYHNLISPGTDFYSWQRDWQNIARVLLGLPMDCDMDELRLALALRGVEEPK